MLANGLSAPQHSTYLVILLEGLDLAGIPPGVANTSLKPDSLATLLLRDGSVPSPSGRNDPFSVPGGFWNGKEPIVILKVLVVLILY